MTKELTIKESNELSEQIGGIMDLAAGFTGLEELDMGDFLRPQMNVLQKMSPAVGEVEGAKAGMFYMPSTGELAEELTVICAGMQKKFVEWRPRTAGGGFVGEHPADVITTLGLDRDTETGKFITPQGNELIETFDHYCVWIKEDGSPEKVVISCTSTQLKMSRKWHTLMAQRINVGGKIVMVPVFSQVYRLFTVDQSNNKGSWKAMDVEKLNIISDKEDPYLLEAYEWGKLLKEGQGAGVDRTEE